MAKQTLPVNFKDDILEPSMGGKRRYNLIQNDDGTYSLEDVTDYTQTGSDFGAGQINATNQAVNESCDKADVIDDLEDVVANQANGKIAGAKAVAELNGNIETGEDSNGNRYVRFKNKGLQICYGTFQATVALSANGSGFTGVSSSIQNGVFPKPFSDLRSLVIQKNDGDWATILSKSANSEEITQVVLGYWGGYTSRSFAFDYVAIGTYTV